MYLPFHLAAQLAGGSLISLVWKGTTSLGDLKGHDFSREPWPHRARDWEGQGIGKGKGLGRARLQSCRTDQKKVRL
jgi:hypothetical protein